MAQVTRPSKRRLTDTRVLQRNILVRERADDRVRRIRCNQLIIGQWRVCRQSYTRSIHAYQCGRQCRCGSRAREGTPEPGLSASFRGAASVNRTPPLSVRHSSASCKPRLRSCSHGMQVALPSPLAARNAVHSPWRSLHRHRVEQRSRWLPLRSPRRRRDRGDRDLGDCGGRGGHGGRRRGCHGRAHSRGVPPGGPGGAS